jgi:excisionase family DNA binding protein|tara:strand:+ start:103 stop:303 length:201 start_codon:yes stop_codon:yes gene_type:complete
MTKHASKIRTSPPRILSVLEAAEYLTISERKIRYEIASGTLRVARIGRRIVVRLKDLDEHVEERLY